VLVKEMLEQKINDFLLRLKKSQISFFPILLIVGIFPRFHGEPVQSHLLAMRSLQYLSVISVSTVGKPFKVDSF